MKKARKRRLGLLEEFCKRKNKKRMRVLKAALREARAALARNEAGCADAFERHEADAERLADTIRDLREQLAKPKDAEVEELRRKVASTDAMWKAWEGKALEVQQELKVAREMSDALMAKGVEQKQEIERCRNGWGACEAERNEWKRKHDIALGACAEAVQRIVVVETERNEWRRKFESVGEFDRLREEQFEKLRVERDEWKKRYEVAVEEVARISIERDEWKRKFEELNADLEPMREMQKQRDEWKAKFERANDERYEWKRKFDELDARALILSRPKQPSQNATVMRRPTAEELLAGPYKDQFRALGCCGVCGLALSVCEQQDGRTQHVGCSGSRAARGADCKVTGPLRTGHALPVTEVVESRECMADKEAPNPDMGPEAT